MYKKFASLYFTAGLVLGAALPPASAVAAACTNATTRFLGIPATNCLVPPLPLQMINPINVSVVDGFPHSYLRATLSNVPPGYSVSNGVYLDWCVDYHGPIPEPGPLVQPVLYPSSGPLPAHLANTNWNRINYILNHKQGGYTNIQAAIWHFIGGPIPSADPVFAPANHTTATSNLIAAADAEGANFIPGPGEVTAIILDLGANLQLNIIEAVCTGPIEVCIGGHLTICTTNTGSVPLSVLWFKDGEVIPGASGECLSLSNLTEADSGAYCIKVSNACSAVTNYLQLIVTNTLDNIPPVIVCASNRAYQCIGQVPPAPDLEVVTATDNSGMVTLEFAGQTMATNGCEVVIVRTYKATDSCNNISVCSHTDTVRDTVSPVLAGVPANAAYQCMSDVPETPTVTASDNCDTNLQVSVTSAITGTCPRLIDIRWTVTDRCGNTTTSNQVITVHDTLRPVIACPADLIVPNVASLPVCAQSLAQFRALGGLASDNCDTDLEYHCVDGPLLGGNCGGLVFRTHTVIDDCANSASCVQIINIATNPPPLLTCPPNFQVECLTNLPACPTNLAQFIAVGGAATGSNLIYSCSDSSLIGDACGGVITRTHAVIDACTNITRCFQTITLHDTTPPTIVCGQNLTVECGTQWTFDRPSASDNCSGTNVSIISLSTITNQLCGNTFAATRTWQAIDACTNQATCSQTITVVDTLPPVLACGIDLTIECGTTWAFSPPTAVDGCDGTHPSISILGTVTNLLCGSTYSVTRTYKATDACNNMSTNSQSITLVDTTPPALVCGSARTVECGTVWTFDHPTAADACDGTNVTLRVTGTMTNGLCGKTFSATRFWEAVDSCNNTSRCSQVVTVVDTIPPVLVGAPGNETFQCLSDVPAPPVVTATDLCDGADVQVSAISGIGIDGCGFVISQSWTAVDQCSNSVTRSRTITVRDTIAPQLDCGANRTVECGTAWDFDLPGVRDNCDLAPALQILSTVTNALCGRTFSATRTWEALDQCTNRSTCSQTITVVDTTPPSLTCGKDQTVECGTAWMFAMPGAADICDGANLTIRVVNTVTNGLCGRTFSATRTWEALDQCTNRSTCSQTITVVDTTPPSLTCGQNQTVECGTAWMFAMPGATDICDGTNLTIRVVNTVTNGLCGRTFSATRTWEALDQCTNRSTCSQTITVVDTTPPSLTCGQNQTVECGTAWMFAMPGATDICDGTNLTIRVVNTVTNGLCGRTFSATRTWEALDQCTNRSTCSQTITVVDTTPPSLTCGKDQTVECGTAWMFAMPGATDICDGTNLTIRVVNTVTNALCGRTFAATRTWEALDQCTNRATCSQTITVVDTTPPSLTCGQNQTVECGTAWMFAMPGATDICDGTNLTIRVVNTVTNALCGTTFSATRTWEVLDQCTNRATCSQTITVVDTTPPSLTCGQNQTVECGTDWIFALPGATDICDGTNLTIRVVNTVTNALCGTTFSATRTWETVDRCSNTSRCSQVVTVVDTTPPAITCGPNLGVECGITWDFTTPTASDLCDGPNVAIRIVSTITNGLCGRTFTATRTWEATDRCTNSSRCSQTVVVRDTTPPALSCWPNLVIECGTAWSFPSPLAYDLCDGTNLNLTVVGTVTNLACGKTFAVTRTWRATDACTNSATCSQTITLVDGTPPVLVCAGNLTVECGTAWNFTTPTAFDGCDGAGVGVRIMGTTTNALCGQTFTATRTWEAVDPCNNTSKCSQVVTVLDTQPPVLATGTNFVIECGTPWSFTTPTATDRCDGADVPVTIVTTTTNNTCGRTFIATRTYKATDACGNMATSGQTVTVIDTLPPLLLNVPASTNYECLANVPPLATAGVTASDNCDPNVTVTATSVTNGACPTIIVRTWKATDACSNLASASQIITVIERPPVIVLPPSDVLVCQGGVTNFCVVATNACPLTYQWLHGTNVLMGETNSCLTLAASAGPAEGQYCVIVRSPCFSTTACARLTMLTNVPPPGFVTLPECILFGTNLIICPIITAPEGSYTCAWSKIVGNTTNLVTTVSNCCLVLNNYTTPDSGKYLLQVIGQCNTQSATLDLPPPLLVCAPKPCTPLTNCVGTSVEICETNFTPMPGVAYTFQWSKVSSDSTNLIAIVNETNQCLILRNITPADAGTYVLSVTGTTHGVALVTDFCGGIITVLTNLMPRALANVAVCAGASAQFCTEAINDKIYPVAYQWYRNGQLLLNETNPCYFIASVSPAMAGQYCVVVKGSCNTVTNCGALTLQGEVGDFVWEDLDFNGRQDAGEPGISNVVVQLLDCANSNAVQTTVTDVNGFYLFTCVSPGHYLVRFVPPSGWFFTVPNIGSDALDSDPNRTNGLTACFTLTGGETNRTVDGGLIRPSALGDFVWEDRNTNGLQDLGEPGLSNVVVRLMDCGGTLITNTLTDADGKYLFFNLLPGDYKVTFVRPDGTLFTTPNQLPDDADSDALAPLGMTACYTLGSGQTNRTVDAGLVKLGALGDFVWLDSNTNGLQDAGETGIANVTVKLMDCLNVVLATTNTDVNGHYLFTGLAPGGYRVMFNAPPGYFFTTSNLLPDNLDSDPNMNDGMTQCYPLASGETNRTVDAGLYVLEPKICVTKEIACLLPGDLCGPFGKSATGYTSGTNYPAFCYAITVVNCGAYNLTNVTVIDDKLGDVTTNFFNNPSAVFAKGSSVTRFFKMAWSVGTTNTVDASGRSMIDGRVVTATDNAVAFVEVASITCQSFAASPADQDGHPDDNHVLLPPDGNSHLVTFTTILRNDGHADLAGLIASAPALAGLGCNLNLPAYLAAGASYTNVCTVSLTCAQVPLTNAMEVTANVDTRTNRCGYDIRGTNISVRTSCSSFVECQTGEPCLKLTKRADRANASPGGAVTYTYTVQNCGNVTLTNIVVTDDNGTPDVPGDDFVVGTIPTLAAGASLDLTKTILLPLSLCGPDSSGNMAAAGLLMTQVLPDGNIKVTFVQNPNRNDNTYGVNSVGWHQRHGEHRFKDLVNSDHAVFTFQNKAGNVVLKFMQDYITASAGFPSGFGCLGVAGGDGGMIVGSAASVLDVSSSLEENINKQPFLGNLAQYTVNSPAPSDPNYPLWETRMIYTCIIDKNAFGASGFGSVAITDQHNSPPKTGPESFMPMPCDSCVTNIAIVIAKAGGLSLTNSASAVVCTTNQPCNPALLVTGTCQNAPTFGGSIAFSGLVRNTGDSVVTNITVTHSIVGLVKIIPSLAPGASMAYNGSFTPAGCGTNFTATVTAAGRATCNGSAVNVTSGASTTCSVPCTPPCLDVVKQIACLLPADQCGPFGKSANGFRSGTNFPAFCYSITVSNCGTVTLTNLVVNDNQLGNLTTMFFASPSTPLPMGNAVTKYFKLSHDTDATNTVTVTGKAAAAGAQAISDTDSAVAYVHTASLTCQVIVSTVGDEDGNPADAHAQLPDDGNFHSVTFVVVAVNTGEADLANVRIDGSAAARLGCANPAPFNLPAHASRTNVLCVASLACTNLPLANGVTVTADIDRATGACAYDLRGSNITVKTTCEALVECAMPGACRVTGGGRQDTTWPAVRYMTHGGQVGAPVGTETVFDPDSACIHGNWEHVRHDQSGNKGNFHAKSFDSLLCACLACLEEPGSGFVLGGLCNPGARTCGPEPRRAPANKICFSGVGDYAESKGGREPRSVLFRVDVEDRSEPGNSSAGGGTPPADRHRIRIWILTDAELAKLNNTNDRLLDFRRAIACTPGSTRLEDGAVGPNGRAVPLGTPVFGVRPPDIDDGGEMTHGNHQIHPSIKDCP